MRKLLSILLFIPFFAGAQTVNIFGNTSGSTTVKNDGQALTIGMVFQSNTPGFVSGGRYFKVTGMNGPHTLALYNMAGTALASIAFSGETASGWQTQNFTSPISISANTSYVIAVFMADNKYVSNASYFTSNIVSGSLTALSNANSTIGNGVYHYGAALGFPNSNCGSCNGPNYWVDVNFQATSSPVANAGPDQTISLPTTSVTLNGTASTGSPSTYSWTRISGPNGPTIVSPNSSITSVTGLVQGTYDFRLTVGSPTSTDDVIVTVQPSQNFTFTTITRPDPVWGAGVEFWNGVAWTDAQGGGVKCPAGFAETAGKMRYARIEWISLENATAGVYNFTALDNIFNVAIDQNKTAAFRIMPFFDGSSSGSTVGGAHLAYPSYLHTLMQGEATKDWIYATDGVWIPNWNSPNYIARWQALLNAVAAHIATATHSGKNYKDVLYYVDVSGFGNFGEWHDYPYWTSRPGGTGGVYAPTSATLKTIMDASSSAFPNYPLLIPIGAFDGGNASIIPPDVTYYALTTSNTWGKFGWRRDNWGARGYSAILENNTGSYNPGTGTVQFSTLIMSTYTHSPVGGEPNNDGTVDMQVCGTHFCDLLPEVQRYHAAHFGDGNIAVMDGNAQTAFRTSSLAAGYNYILTGGSMTNVLTIGQQFNISLNWQNTGLAPSYEAWTVQYELRSGATVVWTGTSTFSPKLFLPSATATTITDTYTLPGSVTPGTYDLYTIVRDPKGYKTPLALSIAGRDATGGYLTRSAITVSGSAPVANAGPDQTITAPSSSVNLTAAASTGTITSYSWTQISGPNTASITSPTAQVTPVIGLIVGTYVFQVTLNGGSSDQVQITVNPQPAAAAGPDQTITLPTNSVTVNGGQSVGATSYQWTRVSGPNTPTITSPTNAVTTITGLIQGVYVFQLSINSGASTDQIQITVNPQPAANAGANQSITLPTNSVTLNGSSSVGATTYQWSQVSGPNSATLTNPTAVSTNATGLIAGTYVFQLSINSGISTATTQVVVNLQPIANAGVDQSITSPASSVTVNGSGSQAATSYLWTQVSGPNSGSITNPTNVSTTITGLIIGTYVFQLSINGGVSTDQMTVVVNPTPFANAGPDQTITLPTSSVTIDGSASTGATSYSWTRVSGPNTPTITTPTAVSTTVTGLIQGTYVFQLSINSGASTDQVQITVNPAVHADAGANQTITLPTSSVTLNGSASTGASTYAWTRQSGPNTPTITSPTSVTTTVTGLIAGTYVFQLSVNSGASTATTQVVVNPQPVANAGPDQSIMLPTSSVTLNGNLSINPTSYLWAQLSGPNTSTIATPTTVSTNVTGLIQGTYVFQLSINGGLSTDQVQITVSPPVFANAGPDQTITLPLSTVTLNGSLSTGVTSSVWTKISGPGTPTITTPSALTTTVTGLIQGTYVFRLSINSAASTDDIQITVNPQPLANAGPDQTITLPTSSVTVNGSGSVAATTYLWTQINGPGTATITAPTTVSTSITGLVSQGPTTAGVYTFQLSINGGINLDQMNVTVNPQLVANAGPDQKIFTPASSVVLNSVASSGIIANYLWTQVSGPGNVNIQTPEVSATTVSGLVPGIYVFQLSLNSGASTDQVQVTVVNTSPCPDCHFPPRKIVVQHP